jgi:ketosteroid isomerase-like protein
MRRYFISAALTLAVCCSWSCRSTAPPSTTRTDPSEVVLALLHAFNNLDVGELRSLFAEDATAFLPLAATGARLDGRDAIMRAIEPMFTGERARSSHGAPYLALTARDLKVQRIGNTVAIVSFDVGNQNVFSRRTVILQIISDRWRIVHLHASNVRTESGAG